ncbi:MAG: bifunctional nuclease family protein [Atopobiaceae bacterium]
MSLVRMDIQAVVVGGGVASSLVVLKPHGKRGHSSTKLPIRIGAVESAAISMGVDGQQSNRPMTHDLMLSVIDALDGSLTGVSISEVHGTTFYAQLRLLKPDGEQVLVDARPSDAIALAVRTHAPIFAEQEVLDTAGMPDFRAVREEEQQEEIQKFHEFVENLSPDDFSMSAHGGSDEPDGGQAPEA